MKAYSFTGHLSPLPPGINLPLQLSGTVYLPHDVNERVAQLESQIARLQSDNASLRGSIRALRRSAKDKKSNALRR